MIRSLRSFIGVGLLASATSDYYSAARQADGVRAIRLHDRQPLIEAFEKFDKITFHGRRELKCIPQELADLVNLAGIAQAVIPTLDVASANHHRKALIGRDNQYKSLLLEWKTAAQLICDHKTSIAWTPPGQSGPEFVAIADGVMVEVECKWQTTMVTQILGDNESDRLAAAVLKAISDISLCGQLTLDLPEASLKVTDGKIPEIVAAILAEVCSGNVDLELPIGIRLSGTVSKCSGQRMHTDAWQSRIRNLNPENNRCYGMGHRDGDYVVDPIDLLIEAPLKNALQLQEDLWVKKFEKAAKQCTGERGAILVYEWESVDEPSLFAHHPMFQSLMADTFKNYPYVSRIIMRCDNEPLHANGAYSYATAAYSAESNAPKFPETTPFLKLQK